MNLTDIANESVRKNARCKNLLAIALDKSVDTIERWLRTDDIMLTTHDALQIIEKETGLSREQILLNKNVFEKL